MQKQLKWCCYLPHSHKHPGKSSHGSKQVAFAASLNTTPGGGMGSTGGEGHIKPAQAYRPLHSYMDINENFEDYHRSPTFPELFVTKLVVTQVNIRCQMKDMDIIFLLIPLCLLWVDTTAFRSQAFFPNAQKCWKLTIFTWH